MTSIPYWRLSSFYFFYFSLVGCILPYWALFLEGRGFSASEIGELMALMGLTRIVAPNIWAHQADRSGKPLTVLRIGAWLTPIIFMWLLLEQGFWMTALIIVGFNFFSSAILPQFEVITLNHLGDQSDKYAQVRLWGSIGFVVLVCVLGWWFQTLSIGFLPWVMLALMLLIAVATLTLPLPDQLKTDHTHTESIGFVKVLCTPIVIFVILANVLNQVSHGPYNTFFSIYLKELGYGEAWIGAFWGIGVVAEIFLFMKMHQLIRHYRLTSLIVVALLLTAFRWLGIALFADIWWGLFLLQTIHAFSFGVMHAATVEFIRQYFPKSNHSQGQALYSSLSFGAGSAMGALLSGYLWEGIGGVWLFSLAAIPPIIGALVILYYEHYCKRIKGAR